MPEIAAAVHAVDGLLVYDASHVFGLLAAGRFQQPLAEGADVIYGSTHKTLFGPQGGLILSNDEQIMAAVSGAIYPPWSPTTISSASPPWDSPCWSWKRGALPMPMR
jgi:glycine/serine hydroxymethyltransferase